MKKLVAFASLFLFTLGVPFAAHAELQTSNPAVGSVVQEKTTEIKLTFKDEILKDSKIMLEKDNTGMEFKLITVEGNAITATVDKPLENGSYVVYYTEVTKTGESVNGIIPFTVEMKGQETPKEESTINKEDTTPSKEETDKKEPVKEDEKKAEKDDKGSFIVYTVVGLLVVVLVTIVLLKRRN